MQVPIRTLYVALLIGALPNVCFAENVYVEGLVGSFETHGIDNQVPEPGFDFSTIGVRTGYEFNKHLAVEGELITGSEKVALESYGNYPDASVNLKSHAAVFARVSAPLNERLSMHGRVGYASLELSNTVASDAAGGYMDTHAGPAFGVGTKFNLSDKIYLRGDHTRYTSETRENRVYTIGAGVNLFQVAKVVNDLRD